MTRAVGRGAARAARAALAVLTVAAALALAAPPASAAIEWASDSITTFEGVARSVERGTLLVPEDRGQPAGTRIHLGFVRLRATGKSAGSPILFLAGGPGVPATFMARIPAYDRFFQKLRGTGDVILVDQRGCGLSDPLLVCSPKEPLPSDVFVSEERTRIELDRAFGVCATTLRSQGVRPEAYHQRASAGDLEELRLALGPPRLRLVAYSSGTELAQEYLRAHGDRVERVVFIGTRSTDEAWRLPSAFDFHVRRLARFVARDSTFGKRFPDFEGAIRAAAESLDAHPRTITVLDRRLGANVDLVAGGFALRMVMQGDLIDPFGFGVAPALLQSLAQGDDALFAFKVGQLYNSFTSITNVELVGFDCASGADGDRVRRIEREASASLFGGARGLLQRPALCREIGAGDLGAAYRDRVYSAAPALFLTGSLDGNSPPYQAEEVRWGFPNGIHIVVPSGWHELIPVPDVQQTVADYLAGEDVAGRRLVAPPPRLFSIPDAKKLLGVTR
ncbi:MAG TPA: alpha/beta fold hydrolase [Candidatus Eisenbacteria bacterium]|nr:alpha/beta fold hydrolase [Candidatus Eisenbacteria bacterium]